MSRSAPSVPERPRRSATLVALAALLIPVLLLSAPRPARAGYADLPPIPADSTSMAQFAKDEIARADGKLKEVLAVKGPRTIENTLVPYNELSIHLDIAGQLSDLLENVHPADGVRAAAALASQDVSQYASRLSLNPDLYQAISSVDTSAADPTTRYLVRKMIRDFKRSGVDRDEPTRKQIEALQEELVKIGQDFDKNIRENRRTIALDSPGSLEGLPQDFIDAHKPGADGKILISTDYPDYFPFMTYSKDGDARRQLYIQFMLRGNPANLEVLNQLREKRFELARLLGYPTWADYVTEDKMIETRKHAADFIDRIAAAAEPRAEKEYQELLAEKKKDDPAATVVNDWDKFFYQERVKSQRYSFDSQSVRPYFDYPIVRDGILGLTSKMFGVTFRKVDGVAVWDPEVECYDVLEGTRYLGRFFLDMHPRDGKYKHAAQFTFRTGVEGVQSPVGVLVCNFPGSLHQKPGEGLMEHDDVETFLHEFGHLLHHIFAGHHRWIDQSGGPAEWDFIEAPSQFLEEWAWDAPTLQTFARRFDTGEVIPTELVNKMRAARDYGKGITVRQQMFYAKLSLSAYDQDPGQLKDTTALVRDLQNRYSMFHYVDGTSMQTGFGHLNGYSAIYYTYMWSLVIAKDLFSRFDPKNLLDPAEATTYRKAVLDPGGTKRAADLVHDFLGRDFSFDAYSKWLNSD